VRTLSLISLFALTMCGAISTTHAQTATDLNAGLRVVKTAVANEYEFSWWGKSGHSYFVQISTDLVNWTYVPDFIEGGSATAMAWGMTTNAPRHFLRLRYINQTAANLESADFDNDGVGNLIEITPVNQGGSGTDPLNPDTDGDGFPDGLELANGFPPTGGNSSPFVKILGYYTEVQSLHNQAQLAYQNQLTTWEGMERKANAVINLYTLMSTEVENLTNAGAASWMIAQMQPLLQQAASLSADATSWLPGVTLYQEKRSVHQASGSAGNFVTWQHPSGASGLDTSGSWSTKLNSMAWSDPFGAYLQLPIVGNELLQSFSRLRVSYSELGERMTEEGPDGGTHHAVSESRFQMIASHDFENEVSQDYLIVTSSSATLESAPPTKTVNGGLTFTIPAGQRVSNIATFNHGQMAWGMNFVTDLLFIGFADEEEATGLDTLSRENWLMVPQFGSSAVKVLNGTSLDMRVFPEGQAYIAPDQVALTSNQQLVTFGEGGALGGPEYLVLGKGEDFADFPLLKFAVKPYKVLKVSVHPIQLISATGQVLETPNTPTRTELEDYLNKVFEEQTNIHCSVTIKPMASVNWDVGMGINGSSYGIGNRFFDIKSPLNGGGFSDEELAVQNASNNPAADVNVYFIAAGGVMRNYAGMWMSESDGSDYSPLLGYGGKATYNAIHAVYVWDFPVDPDRPNHCWAIAHEIAHFIGNLGHSTDDFTISHLPGTDNELRLMTGAGGPKRASNPRMLIKKEWDALQKFFER
jgi:hypothetical protein